MTNPPIERTITFTTTVDELTDAWSFIMANLPEVGPDPEVSIKPLWAADHDSPLADADYWSRKFEVSVSGMEEVKPV
jgi:hypothetical protein